MTTAEVMAEVSRIPAMIARLAREAPVENLPRLLGVLAEAQAVALARLSAARPTDQEPEDDDRLLTLPEVAEILTVATDYVYTLARQRKIPTVRLPGLEKGGRTCEGKYLRVRASSLRSLLAGLEDRGIDGVLNTMIKSLHDRKRGAKAQAAARADAGRVRPARRRHVRDGEPVGDARDHGPGADGEADPAPRPGQEGTVTPWR